MTTVYAAAYLAKLPKRSPATLDPVGRHFWTTRSAGAFPYDVGDDPSFFAAAHLNGAVTWGVCRPNVRDAILTNNWMAFFAAKPAKTNGTEYFFVALLQVAYKLTHFQIYGPTVSPFRSYLNRLVEPIGAGWQHFEPSTHTLDWHDDAFWRICKYKYTAKADLTDAQKSHIPGNPILVGGSPVVLGENYVVFSRSAGFVLVRPLLIAHRAGGASVEAWRTGLPAVVRQQLLNGNTLRIANRQNPHPCRRTVCVALSVSALEQQLHSGGVATRLP